MENFSLYFMLFLIYSFMGWLIEVCNFLITEKKFINRGFMLGPYCPIYGSSAIIMIFYLEQYKSNILTVFLLAVVVCSFMEYIISYIMEKLFNARWWDYSDRKFNINGRVCLVNAFLFGLLGVGLVYFVNPLINGFLLKINSTVLIVISIVWFAIFISDFIISMSVTFELKKTIKKLKKDSTEEFNKRISELLEKKTLNRRIFKAFPQYKINIISIREIKDKISDRIDIIEDKIADTIEKVNEHFDNSEDKK